MKILFYNHTGKISGAECVLLAILAGLDRRRYEPVVLCPSDGPLETSLSDLRIHPLEIDPVNARFTWRIDRLFGYLCSIARIVRSARRTVKSEAPDIIHANSIRAGIVMSAATVGFRVPVIWHVHDLLPRHPLSTFIRLFAATSRRNRIVAVSNAVSDRFRGRVLQIIRSRAPVTTIYNAVDLKQFHPDRDRRADARRALGFDDGTLLIGTVGQLTPRKGQLELTGAFAEAAKHHPNIQLFIVGEALFNRDAEYAELLKLAVDRLGINGRVHFLSQRDDIPDLMRAFDLVVVNSSVEPFGLTVIEAMAAGTAVLATAVDGICEIVRHGKTGWLVPAQSRYDLVAGLRKLIDDPLVRSELSTAARAEVAKRFSSEKFLQQFTLLYRQLNGCGNLRVAQEFSSLRQANSRAD